MNSRSLKTLALLLLIVSACGKKAADESYPAPTPLLQSDVDIYSSKFETLEGWDVKLNKQFSVASPNGLVLTAESEYITPSTASITPYCSSSLGAMLLLPLKQNPSTSATLDFTIDIVQIPTVSDSEYLTLDFDYVFGGKKHSLLFGKESLLILGLSANLELGKRVNPLDMSVGRHNFRFVFEDKKLTVYEDNKVLEIREYDFYKAEEKDSLYIRFNVSPKFTNLTEAECKNVKKGKVIIESLNISSKPLR